MQGAALTASNFSYKNGTIRFTKVPRTVSLSFCLQEGEVKPGESLRGGVHQKPLVLFLEHIPGSVLVAKSKRIKINLKHMTNWNLKAIIQPGTHTLTIFSTYRIGDSNEVEDSETCFSFRLEPFEVLRFNILVRSLALARCTKADPKGLKASPQRKLLRGPKNIVALEPPKTSTTTNSDPLADPTEVVVKA